MIKLGLHPVYREKKSRRHCVALSVQRDGGVPVDVGHLLLFEDELKILEHVLRSGVSVFVDNEADYSESVSSVHAFLEGIDGT